MSAMGATSLSPEPSEKLQPRHLERTAVVYIRQSSMTQVQRHQESTKIQYGLVTVAEQLGWARERILVIDDDLGLSGASAAGRAGFQRLLAEVALDHVGLIVGVEMSRLARSNKDWHQLLELCARFGTLIADLDGLYDPARYNDRLLLGLKGTMSEAELHILRQRLLHGKLHKAKRGELRLSLPTGYVRSATGEVVFDPDEEVQAAVRAIFEEYDRLGSIHGVLRVLVARGVQIGVRRRVRPDLGTLEWHRPHRGMVLHVLRHPAYAGAYAYGRRRVDPRRQQPGRPATGRTALLPPSEWMVCLRDRLPAYITWAQYEQNQRRLQRNREQHAYGPPRDGAALLAGLVVCGRCGYRMSTQYSQSANGRRYARYVCSHAAAARGEALCASLAVAPLDRLIADLVLRAVAPAALEVSLRVSETIEHERAQADAVWAKRLQRARFEADRAARQYHTVEPENRLVARTLERAWEEKLAAERMLQEEDHRRQTQQPRVLTAADRATIEALATQLPTLWTAPTTTPADRKAVIRLLVDRVVATVEGVSECVAVVVHWAGGHETHTRVQRPVGKLHQLQKHAALLETLRHLRREGYSASEIAAELNAAGWCTPTQRNAFNERLVRAMVARYARGPRGPRRPPSNDRNEWWLTDLAAALQMPVVTLYGWVHRGWLQSRRHNGRRIVIADPTELRRLRDLRKAALRFGRWHSVRTPSPSQKAT